MQKYGPPPGYPTLKIPGVNMPIPSHIKMDLGGLFSDERDNTVYADCHGLNPSIYKKRMVKKSRWGELDDEDGQEEELGDDLL
jgi:splicing factor 3B subunit 2